MDFFPLQDSPSKSGATGMYGIAVTNSLLQIAIHRTLVMLCLSGVGEWEENQHKSYISNI